MPIKSFIKNSKELLQDTFKGFADHRVPKLGGSLAYCTVFSMGPLLIVIISLCGLIFEREAIEGRIYNVMKDFIGPDTALQLQEIIKNAGKSNQGHLAATLGIIMLIIGATAVFAEIQDSINEIWGLKTKPKKGFMKILRTRFLSFSVIVSIGFLLLVSLMVSALVETINTNLKAKFPDVAVVLFYIVNLVLTFGSGMLIFAVIFKVLPDAKIKWKDVMMGAVVTTILFLLGKFLISLYISQTKIGTTFGAAGSLVVLLVWVYYSSIILYLGAEFTKAYAIKYGSNITPNDYAVSIKQIEIETGNKINS